MKPIRMLVAAAILAALSLTACGRSIQEETEARFKLNPHPKQAYRLKIKINNAPGPLKLTGDLGIRYKTPDCSYEIDSWAGAMASPEKRLEAETRQTGKFEYETVVYADAMQDEDYFGTGICRWEAQGFGIAFNATGDPKETRFNFGDFLNDLMAKESLTKYYWKEDYPYSRKEDGSIFIRSDGVGFTDWGGELDMYGSEKQEDLFSITVNIEKVKL